MTENGLEAEITNYIYTEYAVKAEHPWEKTAGNAVFRCQGNGKWFAVLIKDVKKRSLPIDGDGTVDVLNLKRDPRMSVVDHVGVFPAYHMNKEHWISVLLDGSVPMEQIQSLIAFSYELVSRKRK
ncbi:MAG: MmcQ/YjbR family DNA-binding protein [Methanocorpusculum sp.]|nr:MmcQ/YjbR family DNA-binding protein [Oscillospiraceae bacterium]MBQ3569411.1 MmcQ/YjbR family DNA-binding protein [Methanocorpusculum sp.]